MQAQNSSEPVGDRFELIRLIRSASPRLRLKSAVIATLDILLSFLPRERSHNTVFASNHRILERLGGLTERSLRRHIAQLEELGLLKRIDSPNQKRFTRYNGDESRVLRFGLSLTPAFEALPDLRALSEELLEETRQIAWQRQRLRQIAALQLSQEPDDAAALTLLKTLRRKLSLTELETLEQNLAVTDLACEQVNQETARLAASNGQIVRHHYNSEKEYNEQKTETVEKLVELCPSAAELSLHRIISEADVEAHARHLAPMLGIEAALYQRASTRHGETYVAQAIWWLTGQATRIRHLRGYFNAILLGRQADSFSLIRALHRSKDAALRRELSLSADNILSQA